MFVNFITNLYSEEIGRIYIGDHRKLNNQGLVNGMVIDQNKSNVIHVLTTHPLELHSFYPVKYVIILQLIFQD